jgi:hypothetical protein
VLQSIMASMSPNFEQEPHLNSSTEENSEDQETVGSLSEIELRDEGELTSVNTCEENEAGVLITESFVSPYPNKGFLTKKGKLNHAVRKHFDQHCMACGSDAHQSGGCPRYRKNTKTLCPSCRRGFHTSCQWEAQTESPIVLQEGQENENENEPMLQIFRLLIWGFDHLTVNNLKLNQEIEEFQKRVVKLERIIGILSNKYLKETDEIKKYHESEKFLKKRIERLEIQQKEVMSVTKLHGFLFQILMAVTLFFILKWFNSSSHN